MQDFRRNIKTSQRFEYGIYQLWNISLDEKGFLKYWVSAGRIFIGDLQKH